MRVAVFSVCSKLTSDGSRLVSALLKRAGHEVRSVFLARSEPLEYGPAELEHLDPILRETDVVLIAVYSSYVIRAVQVTEYVKSRFPNMVVVWGGPHCISVPELCLRFADGVCFSEGDEAVLDLLNRMSEGADYLRVPNMAFNRNGTQVVNTVLPPFADVDSLPYYDYDLDTQFILDGGLSRISEEKFKERCAAYPYYVPTFYYLTSRGCPYTCSYCNNCRYVDMFGSNRMRFQSVDRIIEELRSTLSRLDFIELVGFGDDDFFARPLSQLEGFAGKYKEMIGLPFGVAISANSYSPKKMELLVQAGLKFIQMGVESGSQRVLDEVYSRKIKVERTKEVVKQITEIQKNYDLDFFLDFIIDNPYETTDDVMRTYEYLIDLPSRVKINLFLLAFFPGTPIYERALQDGFITPFDEKASRFYLKSTITYHRNYEMLLVLLLKYLREKPQRSKYVSQFVLRGLGSRAMRSLGAVVPNSVYGQLIDKIK
jgi:radical SAM superfamily enzyme YgiQ (UPF0313 family)